MTTNKPANMIKPAKEPWMISENPQINNNTEKRGKNNQERIRKRPKIKIKTSLRSPVIIISILTAAPRILEKKLNIKVSR
jgi:hypothetical protein